MENVRWNGRYLQPALLRNEGLQQKGEKKQGVIRTKSFHVSLGRGHPVLLYDNILCLLRSGMTGSGRAWQTHFPAGTCMLAQTPAVCEVATADCFIIIEMYKDKVRAAWFKVIKMQISDQFTVKNLRPCLQQEKAIFAVQTKAERAHNHTAQLWFNSYEQVTWGLKLQPHHIKL